jgi:hypothetical protein
MSIEWAAVVLREKLYDSVKDSMMNKTIVK